MFGIQFKKTINSIKEEITLAGSLGIEMLDKSIRSIQEKKINLAHQVVDVLEPQLNDLEIKIERKCIDTLAKYKPQVKYLRSITMFIKMNDDLERIGDLACGIAVCSEKINKTKSKLDKKILDKIFSKTFSILLKANQSLKNEDIFNAHEVLKMDSEINKLRDNCVKNILKTLKKSTSFLESHYEVIKIAQKLERIGDLSKNIAEEVIFIVSGELLKHGKRQ